MEFRYSLSYYYHPFKVRSLFDFYTHALSSVSLGSMEAIRELRFQSRTRVFPSQWHFSRLEFHSFAVVVLRMSDSRRNSRNKPLQLAFPNSLPFLGKRDSALKPAQAVSLELHPCYPRGGLDLSLC